MKNLDNITKAIRYITNIRDENYVKLDNFKKEIECNKDSKTHYSTLVYDNRIENCNTILEVLEKQVTKEVDTETINKGINVSGEYDIDSHMLCPNCKAVVGDYEADELYFDYCPTCGQKLRKPQEN